MNGNSTIVSTPWGDGYINDSTMVNEKCLDAAKADVNALFEYRISDNRWFRILVLRNMSGVVEARVMPPSGIGGGFKFVLVDDSSSHTL